MECGSLTGTTLCGQLSIVDALKIVFLNLRGTKVRGKFPFIFWAQYRNNESNGYFREQLQNTLPLLFLILLVYVVVKN